jgi:hypothetical protein
MCSRLASFSPASCSGPGWTKLSDPSASVVLASGNSTFTIGFDATGAITTLVTGGQGGGRASASGNDGTSWASAERPLAALVYQTFNESDWKPFTYDYINGWVGAWSLTTTRFRERKTCKKGTREGTRGVCVCVRVSLGWCIRLTLPFPHGHHHHRRRHHYHRHHRRRRHHHHHNHHHHHHNLQPQRVRRLLQARQQRLHHQCALAPGRPGRVRERRQHQRHRPRALCGV